MQRDNSWCNRFNLHLLYLIPLLLVCWALFSFSLFTAPSLILYSSIVSSPVRMCMIRFCVCFFSFFLLLLVLWLLHLHRRRHDDTNGITSLNVHVRDVLCSLYHSVELTTFLFLPIVCCPIRTLNKCNNILNYRFLLHQFEKLQKKQHDEKTQCIEKEEKTRSRARTNRMKLWCWMVMYLLCCCFFFVFFLF